MTGEASEDEPNQRYYSALKRLNAQEVFCAQGAEHTTLTASASVVVRYSAASGTE